MGPFDNVNEKDLIKTWAYLPEKLKHTNCEKCNR